MWKEKTPRRTVISRRGCLTWSCEGNNDLGDDTGRASTPVKRKLSRMNSQEEMCVQIKSQRRQGRWHPLNSHYVHTRSDEKLWSQFQRVRQNAGVTPCVWVTPTPPFSLGGKRRIRATAQTLCGSSSWVRGVCQLLGANGSSINEAEILLANKMLLFDLYSDGDFWFPMSSAASEAEPTCARGHTATYDPDSKAVFVYGGLRENQRYNELHILNTLTWKWKNVTVGLTRMLLWAIFCYHCVYEWKYVCKCIPFFKAKGNVPHLAYHSAVFYKKELFVFGGVQPSRSLGDKCCTNALYIFNPEYELWYQPIVDGDKPLARFGSAFLQQNPLLS